MDDSETIHGGSDLGTVMVDIGGDVGAAIIWTPQSLHGQEIEIRRPPAPWDGTHTSVRPRETGEGTRDAALFGSLPAGEYELRARPAQPNGVVVALRVVGAEVTTVAWPEL